MRYFPALLLLYNLNLFAGVNTIEALYETTPIPAGLDSTDDIAIWLHPEDAAKSLIAGVSKTKPKAGNHAGIGLYNLQGRQMKYLEHDRLNNVDIKYDLGNLVVFFENNTYRSDIQGIAVVLKMAFKYSGGYENLSLIF